MRFPPVECCNRFFYIFARYLRPEVLRHSVLITSGC